MKVAFFTKIKEFFASLKTRVSAQKANKAACSDVGKAASKASKAACSDVGKAASKANKAACSDVGKAVSKADKAASKAERASAVNPKKAAPAEQAEEPSAEPCAKKSKAKPANVIRLCAAAVLCAAGCLLVSGGDMAFLSAYVKQPTLDYASVLSSAVPDEYAPKQSPTTGIWSYEWPDYYEPIGVMIENQFAARPQWGLQTADVVYEANAEGTVTRFLAIFNDSIPDFVGPVRSARVYFIRLQQQWDCYYVHCSGPYGPDAINIYSPIYTSLVNRRYNAKVSSSTRWFAWREYSNRITTPKAPHNVFVNPQAIQNAATESCSVETPLKFSYTPMYTNIEKAVSKVQVRFRGQNVVWSYDAKSDKLFRSHGTLSSSAAHMSAETGEQIRIQNLIIQYSKYQMFTDGVHRIITLTGSGKAEYVINGKFFTGTWYRESYETDTIYYDAQGNEVLLSPGKTWIEVCPSDKYSTVTYAE